MAHPPNPMHPAASAPADPAVRRTCARTGRISPEPVTYDTLFQSLQETRWDPAQAGIETRTSSHHYILACGCRVSSPERILGVCPECANRLFRRRPRFVCTQHRLCLACRRRLRRGPRTAPGFLALLARALLWPPFDVSREEDDHEPRPPAFRP